MTLVLIVLSWFLSLCPEDGRDPELQADAGAACRSGAQVVIRLRPEPRGLSVEAARVDLVDGQGKVLATRNVTVEEAERGRLRILLEEQPESLWAQVNHLGWCQTRAALSFSNSAKEWSGSLSFQPGRTVRGRLLDGEGRGVPGSVQLMARFDGSRLGGGVRTRTRETGEFVLHATDRLCGPSRGVRPVLVAMGEGIGTSVLPALDLSRFGSEPGRGELLEVRLRGEGVLRGRVVDSSGQGIPGAEHEARSVSAGEFGEQLVIDEAQDGEGFRRAQTVTAADGSFEWRGLCLESFRIGIVRPGGVWEAPEVELLTSEPVMPDGRLLRLEGNRLTLLIDVLSSDGRAWPGPIELGARFTPLGERNRSWPSKPMVHVVENRRPVTGRLIAPGTLAFGLTRGESVDVEIWGGRVGEPGFLPARHRLGLKDADGQGRLRLVLKAIPNLPMGRARLTFQVTERTSADAWSWRRGLELPPFGTPLPPGPVEMALTVHPIALSRHRLQVELLSDSPSPLGIVRAFVLLLDQGGIDLDLPPGKYRWRVWPMTPLERMEMPSCGGAAGTFEVLAAESSQVDVQIDAGSTLRVLVVGESADLKLEAPDGSTLRLTHFAGIRGSSLWPADRALESTVVPSGEFTLLATFRSTATQRRIPVILEPTECLDVKVTR